MTYDTWIYIAGTGTIIAALLLIVTSWKILKKNSRLEKTNAARGRLILDIYPMLQDAQRLGNIYPYVDDAINLIQQSGFVIVLPPWEVSDEPSPSE